MADDNRTRLQRTNDRQLAQTLMHFEEADAMRHDSRQQAINNNRGTRNNTSALENSPHANREERSSLQQQRITSGEITREQRLAELEAERARAREERNNNNNVEHNRRGRDVNPSINRNQHTARSVLEDRESLEQQPIPEANTAPIKTEQQGKTVNSWRDYLRATRGEDRFSRVAPIVGGSMQALGNAAQAFAHGASGGRTPAPGEIQGDPLGLQGFRELRQGDLEGQQGLNNKGAQINMEQAAADNQLARDERILAINNSFQEKMQDQNFRNSIDMLKQNFEQSKEMLGLTTEQQQIMQQFLADIRAGDMVRSYNNFIDSGIDMNRFADFIKRTQGQRFFDDFMTALNTGRGLISDISSKTNIKATGVDRSGLPKWRQLIPEKVREYTREEKLAQIRKWNEANVRPEIRNLPREEKFKLFYKLRDMEKKRKGKG